MDLRSLFDLCFQTLRDSMLRCGGPRDEMDAARRWWNCPGCRHPLPWPRHRRVGHHDGPRALCWLIWALAVFPSFCAVFVQVPSLVFSEHLYKASKLALLSGSASWLHAQAFYSWLSWTWIFIKLLIGHYAILGLKMSAMSLTCKLL